jgi:hypothetical protein
MSYLDFEAISFKSTHGHVHVYFLLSQFAILFFLLTLILFEVLWEELDIISIPWAGSK